jgi:hypothetical protein
MKTLRANEQVAKNNLPASRMRMVAVSATLPNLKVIGFVNIQSHGGQRGGHGIERNRDLKEICMCCGLHPC